MIAKILNKLSSLSHGKYLTKFMMHPLVTCGTILLLSGIGYYMFSLQHNITRPHQAKETKVVKQDGKIKIAVDTNLVQKIVYSKCKDEEVFRTKPPDSLIGLNYNQVQKIYSGWTIEKFDTKEVEMTLTVDSLCREHANNMFIGIKDGYVAVFYGVPGSKAIVKEVTKIPITGLMPEDLLELQQGLIVQSKEELLRTLEGMHAR